MATIQIRNVPEAVHRTHRARAAAAGMSLQEYLLAEITQAATVRTPGELMAEVAEQMRTEGTEGFSRISAVDIVRADRESH
jgi:plasmid stability protein